MLSIKTVVECGKKCAWPLEIFHSRVTSGGGYCVARPSGIHEPRVNSFPVSFPGHPVPRIPRYAHGEFHKPFNFLRREPKIKNHCLQRDGAIVLAIQTTHQSYLSFQFRANWIFKTGKIRSEAFLRERWSATLVATPDGECQAGIKAPWRHCLNSTAKLWKRDW